MQEWPSQTTKCTPLEGFQIAKESLCLEKDKSINDFAGIEKANNPKGRTSEF
jgi:hypothetical protein